LIRAARELGLDALLLKPFAPSALLEVVAT
jgi:hypothetical protein